MKKKVFGRQLKRDVNERKALFKGLVTDLVLKEKITTTEEKAKSIRSLAEKLVTKAKTRANVQSLLQPFLSPLAVKKVVNDLAKRFANRSGGYVRIIKIGQRFGDNAKMAVIEWVDKTSASNMNTSENKEKVESKVASENKKPKTKAEKVKPEKKKGENKSKNKAKA